WRVREMQTRKFLVLQVRYFPRWAVECGLNSSNASVISRLCPPSKLQTCQRHQENLKRGGQCPPLLFFPTTFLLAALVLLNDVSVNHYVGLCAIACVKRNVVF